MSRVKPIDLHIAKKLRGLRVPEGQEPQYRLNAVAGALGISYQSYQRMEAGSVSFRAGTLQELSQFFGVPVTYFYDDTAPLGIPNGDQIATVVSSMRNMVKYRADHMVGLSIRMENLGVDRRGA